MKILALLLAGATAVASPGPVSFPGAGEAKDPTGRYAVVLAAPGRHDLVLRVAATGAERPLTAFGRSARVAWSPDGNALAITDRVNADRSTVRVFLADKPGMTDLDAVLAKAFSPLPERAENKHVHLEVVRWLNARTVRVRLRGYGERDPDGFDELFDYDLDGRIRRSVI